MICVLNLFPKFLDHEVFPLLEANGFIFGMGHTSQTNFTWQMKVLHNQIHYVISYFKHNMPFYRQVFEIRPGC